MLSAHTHTHTLLYRYRSLSCCLHDCSICKQLFYIEKHWHVGNNQDWVCVAPPIEYTWCQFKMTSSKCPYRSKHQVILLTVYIYRPETLYITQNKHGMLFTGTRIHIVPNFAYLRRFGGDLLTRPAAANHHKHQRNVVSMQDLGRWVFRLFAKASCSTGTDKGQGLATLKEPNYLLLSEVLAVVCSSLRWFACFPPFSLPIVPNSGGDLWWFAVICGRLRWFAVVCDGLRWFVL